MADIRVARLLQLVTILRARTAPTPKELARELEVSKRTIHRDQRAARPPAGQRGMDPQDGH
jgi:predicted DNA-binding transcriptional regulator YafY